MVALNDKFHHNGTAVRSNRCRSGKSAQSEKSVDHPLITPPQHPPRSSAASLCKSVNPPGPIFCGYPDNNRASTEIGTGLNDPETELYYVRNRTYSRVLGRWLQRDPIGYAGGINLYEYVAGRAVATVDPLGLAYMYRVGPIHKMGGCGGSTCRFYRNYYYYQPLGQWDLPASPNGAKLTEFAHAVLTLSAAGRLIGILMNGVTVSSVEYAYFFWLTWKDTRVFTYKCGTRYSDIRWQSTTKNEDFQVHYKSISQWRLTGNNLVVPGQGETLKEIGHNITDLVTEIIHAMEGAG